MKTPADIPLGVRLAVDLQAVPRQKGVGCAARVRWTDPITHRIGSIKRIFDSRDAALDWVADMRATSRTGVDPGQRLSEYVELIGDRWARGIDPNVDLRPARRPAIGPLAGRFDQRGRHRPGDRPLGARLRAVDGEEHLCPARPGARRGRP